MDSTSEIDVLRQAGFSEEAIAAHYTGILKKGGYSQPEINAWLNEKTGAKFRSLNGDEQSDQIKQMAQAATSAAVENDDISFKRLLELGYQQSVTGMLARGKLPDEISAEEYEKMGIFDRAIMSVASIIPDLPVFAVGAKAGGAGGGAIGGAVGSVVPVVGTAVGAGAGATLGAGAGAFGLHAMARQILVDAYGRGDVMSAEELMYRVKNAGTEFLKGSAVGAATSIAGIGGKVAAGKLAAVASSAQNGMAKTALTAATKATPAAAEIFGLTAASAGLDARVPTAQDFIDCAATIGLLKLTYAGTGGLKKVSATQVNKLKADVLPKLYKTFVKTGRTPEQILGEAAHNPIKMQELLELGAESIKKGYAEAQKDPLSNPTDEMARFFKNYIIQRGAATLGENGELIVSGGALYRAKGTRRNFGLTKIIFDHKVPVEDVAQVPRILTDFKPYRVSKRGTDVFSEYRVTKDKEFNYVAVFRDNGTDVLLSTMYDEKKAAGQEYSKKRSVPLDRKRWARSSDKHTAGDYYFVPDAEHPLDANIARDGLKINNGGKVMPKGNLNTADIVKISDVMKRIQDTVNVPVRLGKIRGGKTVQGQYYPRQEMIRLRKANDIAALSHEAGHHLEKIVFGEIGSLEVKQFYDELAPIATKARSTAKAAVSAEGFAQFVAAYVTNPKAIAEKCPKFYNFFETSLAEKAPDVLRSLQSVRQDVDAWVKQPDLMQVLSHVSLVPETPKTPMRQKFVAFKNAFVENFIDDADPLARVSERLGIDRLADNSPYYRARMVRGLVDSVSQYNLGVAQTNYKFKDIGKSLDAILSPLKSRAQMNEFSGYLTAARAVELAERGIETGIPLQSAKATETKLRPKYEKMAREVYQYQKNILQYGVDSGILSQDAVNAMLEHNKKYVPFRRVLEENYDKGVGIKKLKPKNPLKRIKGSTRDIENPLENIIKNTYQIIANAEKNRVALAVADLSKLDKSGEFVFKVTKNAEKIKLPSDLKAARIDEQGNFEILENAWVITDKINERNQISVFRNGVAETYEVAPEIAKIINNLSPVESNWLLRSMGIFSKSLRLGATGLNAGFALKNTVRDTALATISTENHYSIAQLPSTIFSMIKNDDYYKAYKKSGASMATFVKYDRSTLNDQLRTLTSTGYFDDVWNCLKERDAAALLTKGAIEPVTNGLAWLGEKSETMTRFAEFKAAMKGKKFTRENIERAGFDAREVTLDFAKGGATVKFANQFTAFLNANVIGTAKSVEVLAKHPRRAVMILGTLGVLNALKNWDYENWKVEDDIEDVLRVQRNTNYVFTVPYKSDAGIEDVAIIRVPKAQQIGWVSTAFEETTYQFLSALKGKEREDFIDTLAEAFWGELNLTPIPNAVLTPLEVISNHSIYSGKKIVPAAQEKILPEYQYLEQTTETAKALSRAFGAAVGPENTFSPIKFEYMLRGWTGAAGTGILQGIDYIGRKTGVLEDKTPATDFTNLPFIRAFTIRHPSANTENIAKFYDAAEKAEKYVATLALEKKRMHFDTILDNSFWQAYQSVSNYKKNITTLSATARTVQQSDMTANEKRRLLDQIYVLMNEQAKIGLTINKKVENALENVKKSK